MNKKTCNATDLYIAKKLRERRIELKMKQIELAKALDIASQQIFKYENGIDRVPASRLYEFSRLLSVPITFFFEESAAGMQELVVSCANLHGKKVRLKFLQLKAILTNSQTKEDYEVEVC
jgi:transcriptional regulator with XRE-family HTH domain